MSCNLFASSKRRGITPVVDGAIDTIQTATKPVVHVVRRGETLSTIAGKYKDVTYQDIAKANDITNPNSIYVDQRLKIPNQTSTPIPTTPTKPKPTHKPISDDTSTGGNKGSGCEKCYCKKQGIVDSSCNGKGKIISNSDYEVLANELGVEKEVLKAVALTETGSRGSFQRQSPKHATILYERHYMKKLLNQKYSISHIQELEKKYPNLIGKPGNYGTYSAQLIKLKEAKKIDYDSAIESCSWGRFQVMGISYKYLYKTPKELEEAMNMCETQHLALFKEYCKHKKGLIPAMKRRDWAKIAYLYNGKNYKKNNYDIKMKNYYLKLKKAWK